jgi:5-methylcytosine-specific restriction endonuclease McrA
MPRKIPTHRPPGFASGRKPRRVTDAMPGRRSPFTSDRWWRAFRLAFLADPERACCEDCRAQGRVEPATQVHHKVKRSDDREGRHWFDPGQCVALCASCHSKRTNRGE